jgi:hypothetical protein
MGQKLPDHFPNIIFYQLSTNLKEKSFRGSTGESPQESARVSLHQKPV